MKPWTAVANSDAYRELSEVERKEAKRQYFESVVAPRVPDEERAAAWGQFESWEPPALSTLDRAGSWLNDVRRSMQDDVNANADPQEAAALATFGESQANAEAAVKRAQPLAREAKGVGMEEYLKGFDALNPKADDYDREHAAQLFLQQREAALARKQASQDAGFNNRFDEVTRDPVEWFNRRLDERLAGPDRGVVPKAPTTGDMQRLAVSDADAIAETRARDIGSIDLAGESVTRGAGGVASSVASFPEAALKAVEGALVGLNEAGAALGMPEWMLDRSYESPVSIVAPFIEGKTFGSYRMAGTRDIADTIRNIASRVESDQHGVAIRVVARKADDALEHAIKSGDTSRIIDVLSDPRAWAVGAGQAAPSLLASIVGGLPVMMAMEGGSALESLKEYEAANGGVEAVRAANAVIQTTALNTLLEKLGIDAAMGKLPKAVQDKIYGAAISGLQGRVARGASYGLIGGAGEAGTEGLQGANENLSARWYNPDAKLTDGVLLSVMGGAGSGASAGSVSGMVRGATQADAAIPDRAQIGARVDAGSVQNIGAASNVDEAIAAANAAAGEIIDAPQVESFAVSQQQDAALSGMESADPLDATFARGRELGAQIQAAPAPATTDPLNAALTSGETVSEEVANAPTLDEASNQGSSDLPGGSAGDTQPGDVVGAGVSGVAGTLAPSGGTNQSVGERTSVADDALSQPEAAPIDQAALLESAARAASESQGQTLYRTPHKGLAMAQANRFRNSLGGPVEMSQAANGEWLVTRAQQSEQETQNADRSELGTPQASAVTPAPEPIADATDAAESGQQVKETGDPFTYEGGQVKESPDSLRMGGGDQAPAAKFIREGDFWNYRGQRAREIARALDLTVTERGGVPQVGIPAHSLGLFSRDLKDAGITAEFVDAPSVQFSRSGKSESNRPVTPDDLLTLFNEAETIEIKAPEMSEQEIDDAEASFLSDFPEGSRYPRKTRLLERVRRESDIASDSLGGSPETERKNARVLGPFSAYGTRGQVLEPDSFNPKGSLQVHVYGKEQAEAGLDSEPALTITVTPDGDLTINGPSPASETFREFQSRGWADRAKGAGGEVQPGWSALKDPANPDKTLPIQQIIPLLADVHARVRAWRGDEYVGLHWSRATGAMGGLAWGDQDTTAVYFSRKGQDEAAPTAGDGISADTLRAAIAERIPSLSKAVDNMLARGEKGQRGGLVVIDSADEQAIAEAVASKIGVDVGVVLASISRGDQDVEVIRSNNSKRDQGFFFGKSGLTFLVGPNLTADTAPAVLLHETTHGQQRADIDLKAMQMIDQRDLVAHPKHTREFMSRVYDRMVQAGAVGDATEAAAYIVEQAVIEGRQAGFSAADGKFMDWVDATLGKRIGNILRDFVAMIRGWAIRRGAGWNPTVDDLVAIAMAGVKSAARGDVVTRGSDEANNASDSEIQRSIAASPPAGAPPAAAIDAPLSDATATMTVKERVTLSLANHRGWALGALTRDQIADIYGKDMPQIDTFDRVVQAMDQERNKINERADVLVERWRGLTHQESDALADVMHQATLAQFDPDTFNATNKSEDALVAAFDGLGDDAKQVYRDVRDQYRDTLIQLRDALTNRVLRSSSAGQTIADEIRLKFDEYLKDGPYFSLARFGNFVLIADKGEDRIVESFESSVKREMRKKALTAMGWRTETTAREAYSAAKDGASGAFVAKVLERVESLQIDAKEKADLMDGLNQLAIDLLPDASFRKHFKHRKGVPGFSRDAMRAFAASQLHAASHIARIKHADELSLLVDDAQEDIKRERATGADVTRKQEVVNELKRRIDTLMNPTTHPVAAALGQVGFVMSLGGSVASGLVNLTQTPMVTFPWLGAKFGWGKASAALMAASKDYFGGRWDKWSGFVLAENDKLSSDERAALSDLEDSGLINLTQAHDLAGAANTDHTISRRAFAMNRAMKIVGWTFHLPEVFNRQVSALAAYRLAREDGQSHADAVEAARQALIRTHFDYSASNRARFMQGNFTRVITMFKQYSQQMTYLLWRNAYLAMKDESPDVRKEARRMLVGVMSMHFAAAGSLGLPLGVFGVSPLLSLLALGMGDEDDPWDWEVEYRKMLADVFGKTTGEAIAHGPLRMLVNVDFASRVGLGDLWFREPLKEAEGRDLVQAWMLTLLGPVAGYAGNVGAAMQAFEERKYGRGLESLMPKFAAAPLKALRYGTEGVKSWKGDDLGIDLSGADVFSVALGFQPSRLAEMYEGRAAIKNRESRLQDRREEIVNMWVAARMAGDEAGVKEAVTLAMRFNKKNPEMRITMDTFGRSLTTKRRNAIQIKEGVYLPKSRESLRDEGRFANLN